MCPAAKCMRSLNEMNEDRIIKYITLTLIDSMGPVSQNALLDICGDIEKCFEMEKEEIVKRDEYHRVGEKRTATFISQRNDPLIRNRAKEIYDAAVATGISIVTRENTVFPKRFLGLPDLPILLYTKGNLRINGFRDSAGIVGARRCSLEGKEKAIETALVAVHDGYAVISGMAKGIDSYAHTAVLKARGYTIAVLGNGVDICYPNEHDRLYMEIAKFGCILSEYPPGTPPKEYLFPRRNRLIAALSDVLYVVDAGRNSGTTTTVESAVKYGRKVVYRS